MKREGQIQVHSENIFPIIKKWLYSDKDIFLRELVANGCDAIKKLEKLKMMGEYDGEDQPRIVVRVNAKKKTITVEDNGIGMTEDEVEKYITQIAFSGAEEFIQKYKDKADGDMGIIGHFGLGFYSAFMVSESVEIDTLSYQDGAKAVHWKSDGTSSYEISDSNRTRRGTVITLHVSDEEKEFLEEFKIREMLRKYCAFMPYEIYLNPKSDEEIEKDKKKAKKEREKAAKKAAKEAQKKDGEAETAEEPEDDNIDNVVLTQEEEDDHTFDNVPVNDTHPLWKKAPKDCTDEEYEAFYSRVFMDYNKPLFWIHLNVDYPFNLQGILYFPKLANKMEVMPGEVKLYSNQVYVADNIKEVVPEFLLLLKGVIDCPDLPLNVSRSFLQNDSDVQKISKHISKKVSDKLHSIFQEDRQQYEKYWDDISPFLKFGCIKDEGFYDRVKDIVLFKTINGDYKTLEEYTKDHDKKIFYVTDENLQSQYIRMFKEQELNAVILNHPIDTHFISFLEYKEQGTTFTRIDSDISDAMKEGELTLSKEDQDDIMDKFKSALGQPELTVKMERLKAKETPAVVLLAEYTRRMQDMGNVYGMSFGDTKPDVTVILNGENKIVNAISGLDKDSDKAKLICRQIYDLAMLNHRPLTSEEMAGFMERNTKMLEIVSGLGDAQ